MLRPYPQSVPDHVQDKAVAATDQELTWLFHVAQGICNRQEIFLVIGPGAFSEVLSGYRKTVSNIFQDISGEAELLSYVGAAAFYV